MKKLILAEIFCLIVLLFASLEATQSGEMLPIDNNDTEVEQFNLGLQFKYLSGFGLSGNINVNKNFYMTSSASWLFSILDLSFGSGFVISKSLSVFGKMNLITIVQESDGNLLIFPEAGFRYRIFKSLDVEIGAIIPIEAENRNILKSYLNVPFIVNAGIVLSIFNK